MDELVPLVSPRQTLALPASMVVTRGATGAQALLVRVNAVLLAGVRWSGEPGQRAGRWTPRS